MEKEDLAEISEKPGQTPDKIGNIQNQSEIPPHSPENPVSEPSKPFEGTPVPVAEPKIPKFLIVLGIVVVLVAAAAIYITSNPFPNPPDGIDTPVIIEPIEAVLVYADECILCEQSNTFERALSANLVKYDRRDVAASSVEGYKLIEELGINVLPALLLSEKDTVPEIEVILQNGLQMPLRTFLSPNRKGDWFIVEEAQVADNLVPRMFVTPVDNSCSIPQGKVRVDEFADYLNKPSFDAQIKIREMRNQTFPGELEHVFHNDIINDPASQYVALSAECVRAQNEESFKLFNASFFERFFEKREFQKAIGSDLVPTRFIKDQNLLDEKLLEIINNIGTVDVAQYKQCLQGIPLDENASQTIAQQRLLEDAELVEAYSIKPLLPQYIIDCKYAIAGHQNLELSICALHPGLEGCETAALDVEREDKSCNADADCSTIASSCSSQRTCSCDSEVVNTSSIGKYEDLLNLFCGTPETMCDLECPVPSVQCLSEKCVII